MFKSSTRSRAPFRTRTKAVAGSALALVLALGGVELGSMANASAIETKRSHVTRSESDFAPTQRDINEMDSYGADDIPSMFGPHGLIDLGSDGDATTSSKTDSFEDSTDDTDGSDSTEGKTQTTTSNKTSSRPSAGLKEAKARPITNIRAAQQKLLSIGYWHSGVDGVSGTTTRQALMAFQKVNGLKRTGNLDAKTGAALANAKRPGRGVKLNNGMEIDKTHQVIKIIRNTRVVWVINTSTGSDRPYDENGSSGVANTPNGWFQFFRSVDDVDHAPLGDLYRPRYFNGGIAIHGANSVPSYPASHGCARMSNAAIDYVWANDLAPMGSTVVVH